MRLLLFGVGYVGAAVARAAEAAGFTVAGITRAAFGSAGAPRWRGQRMCCPPRRRTGGRPGAGALRRAIAAAPALRWIGYLSTTGVYGDRGGGWVDEDTEPAPVSDRSRRRLAAEAGWRRFADRRAVDLFRLAGIYGPGRSAFDDLRAGTARRIIRPGHAFGRIHRDDIVRAVLAAMRQTARRARAC